MVNTAAYLDLKSMPLMILGNDDEKFIWPTPYNEYLSISKKITENLVELIYKKIPKNELRLGAISVLSVINIDLLRIAKIALDGHYAKLTNTELNIDVMSSPVSFYIFENDVRKEGAPTKIDDFFPYTKKSLSLKKKFYDLARWSKSGLDLRLKKRKGRYDFQNESYLLTEFMLTMGSDWLNIRPELWRWEKVNKSSEDIELLIIVIIEDFLKVLMEYNITPRVINRAKTVARIFLSERLRKAWNNATYISELNLDGIAGDILIGGTPQEIGRLLNWKYQDMGRKVWRFAHGGDRAFFDDVHWGLSEFPYCEEYYVHGLGERDAVDSRLKRCGTYCLAESKPEIVALGSKKHQFIWEKSQIKISENKKNKSKNKKLVLVAGSFLGEKHMGTFDFKTPDPITADTQAWIVRTLTEMGYDISIKTHPGGVDHKLKVQSYWGVPSIEGYYNNDYLKADVFIFDFAGSAFFDALASEKGIVLLDLKNRPFAKETFNDLKQRCEIVSASMDQLNRIRFNREELKEAVENSIRYNGCPEWFAQKYFWGDL